MSTGQTIMIFNSRERALSVDVNRQQAFANGAAMLLREGLDETVVLPDLVGMGVGVTPADLPNIPPNSTVYKGLLPLPQTGTFDFLITAGVLGVYLPDAVPNPDDAAYKYVSDPGISSVGVLTVAANPGPGIRIDILECQPIDTVLETDNRDIFDPSTGLFSPVTVNKVIAKRLTYRIRQGVAGNGFPGVVADWLPLCVISIPAAAANLDTCTIWDVRPLATARRDGPNKVSWLGHDLNKAVLGVDTITAAPARILKGYAEISNGSPWKSGGHLRTGSYAGASGYVSTFDVNDTTNYEPGFAPVDKTLWYLYICSQIFGLPRWAKYTTGGGRVPGNPEGILVISNKQPNAYSGGVGNLQMPTQYGLGVAVQPGGCLVAGICYNPGGGLTLGIPVTSGKQHTIESSVSSGAFILAPPIGAVNNIARSFTLTPGVTHPNHAKSLVIAVSLNITGGTPFNVVPFESSFRILDSTQTETKFEWILPPSVVKLSPLGAGDFTFYVKVPVFPGETSVFSYAYDIDAADGTVNAAVAQVRGWEF